MPVVPGALPKSLHLLQSTEHQRGLVIWGLICAAVSDRREIPHKVKLALLDHLDKHLELLRTTMPFGGRRSREREYQVTAAPRSGYRNLPLLLLKAQHMAATRTELVVCKKAPNKAADPRPANGPGAKTV